MKNLRTYMIFVIVYAIIGAGLQPNVGSDEPVLGQIIFVDDIAGSGPDNPPENYTSIQDAINAASDGDHLYVYKGLYRETIRIPEGKNNIHIVGEEKTLTIIDACQQLNTDAFFIHGGCDFTISDMTIRNSSRDGLVIYANTTAYPSSRNVISNCVVTNHRGYGIKMYVDRANTSVDNNQVRNCQIYENDKSGIFLSAEADTPTYAMNNRVVDSLMYSNGDHGVELTGNQHTESTVIQGCTSYNNQGAGVFVDGSYVEGLQIGESTFFHNADGIYLTSSHGFIGNCTVFNHTGHPHSGGLILDGASFVTVLNLNSFGNDYGIVLCSDAANNTINECHITGNSECGLYANGSYHSFIFNNYFDNTVNAQELSSMGNHWNRSKMLRENIVEGPYLGGNYWSDYDGTDTDGDGLGDTPYSIPSEGSYDEYPLLIPNASSPTVVYVDDDFNSSTPGWQVTHFNGIQKGIDNVSDSGTVFVFQGHYYETLLINKSITLLGEDKDTTILDKPDLYGEEQSVAMSLFSVSNVSISGFTIENHEYGIVAFNIQYSGVNNCSIYDMIFNEDVTGIDIFLNEAQNMMIHDNIMHQGILVYNSFNNEIENNLVNGKPLVYLENQSGTTVTTAGQVILNRCSNISIMNLEISDAYIGIELYKSDNTYVFNNTLSNNYLGISIRSERNTIEKNTIKSNSWGILLQSHYGNTYFYNNFMDNNRHIDGYFASNNMWYNPITCTGNYWDDYTGIDANWDGVGDTPYTGLYGQIKDLYPLMQPMISPPVFVWVDDDFNSSVPGWQVTNFDTIQDGIDAVVEGGTVYVFNGTYTEELGIHSEYIGIYKKINLIGEDKENVIVNCPYDGEFVGILIGDGVIAVTNVTVSGFSVMGQHQKGAGIVSYMGNDNIIIEKCIASSFWEGIKSKTSLNVTIRNCITFNNSRNGGIAIQMGSGNNEIYNCTSYSNSYGIKNHDPLNNNCIFYHNNLYQNTINAYDESSNFWHHPILGEGNYYDDYTGIDNNDDGIGDIPYNISGGSNQDLYPLIVPYDYLTPCCATVYIGNKYYHPGETIDYGIENTCNQIISTGCLCIERCVNFNWENLTCFCMPCTLHPGETLHGSIKVHKPGFYRIKGEYIKANESCLGYAYFTVADVFVDDNFNLSIPGWGYDHFDRIQDGVDAVDEGGIVFVYSGMYTEHILVEKPVEIIGENKLNTIINGTEEDYCLTLHADTANITITNFTLIGGQITGIFMGSDNTIIDGIIAYGFPDYGINSRSDTENLVIKNCYLHNNSRGIFNKGGNGFEVYGCEIENNTDFGIITWSTTKNAYYHHNNFISNVVNVQDDSDLSNIWDSNYYDDYTGEDANGDGIGDTPYIIVGSAGEQDLHPLMEPWKGSVPIPMPFNVTHMGIYPSQKTVLVGEEFNITVYIDPAENIGGWEIFQLNYTQGLVNATKVLPGSSWPANFDNGTIHNEIGIITGIQAWTTGPYVDTNHTACSIHFSAIQPGECYLSLCHVVITDAEFEPIDITLHNCVIDIITSPTIFEEMPANQTVESSTCGWYAKRPPGWIGAYVEDLDDDALYVELKWLNHSDHWVTLKTYNNAPSGYFFGYNATTSEWTWGNTTYIWSIHVFDGYFWVNKTFWYHTGGSRYDVNNDCIVNFIDAGKVWIHRTSQASYDGLYDVNQDGDVNFIDAGLTWVHRD